MSAKVVVLDMDDTLYLERDFARSGFDAVGHAFGELFDAGDFARHCGERLEAGERGNIFDQVLRELGIQPAEELISDMVAVYRAHRPKISLCDDARRFLEGLGDVSTGLISDGPAQTQAGKVDALGLRERIDHIILTGEWPDGFGKPHPRAFESIRKATGCAAADHVYIADNGAKDFLAPNNLGWQTIQILREGRIHSGSPPTAGYEAGNVVSSFDEVLIEQEQAAE